MLRLFYDVTEKDWQSFDDVNTLKQDYDGLKQMYEELDELLEQRDRAYSNAADVSGDYTEYNELCDRIYDLYEDIRSYKEELETIVEDMKDALDKVVDIAYHVNYNDIRA